MTRLLRLLVKPAAIGAKHKFEGFLDLAQSLQIASRYLPMITPAVAEKPLQYDVLRMVQEGNIEIIYAPFDHIVHGAKLVVVGITPGLTQTVNALRAAVESADEATERRLAIAKQTASFSGGVIRSNLVAMLDKIGVARHFGVGTSAELFRLGSEQVHFTSALRYPVFVKGQNYNGAPNMIRTPILRGMIETHLAEEARILPNALWLPLGPKAEMAVMHLAGMGILDRDRVLAGMPHPSGANAERVSVFLGRKDPAHASRQTNARKLIEDERKLSKQIQRLEGKLGEAV